MILTQLEHLRLLKAHLETLLETAQKRTPGEWAGEYELVAQIIPNQSEFGELICEGKSYPDMDFIASCAGNAEAGWKSTLAAIDGLCKAREALLKVDWDACELTPAFDSILAAWPIETLQK